MSGINVYENALSDLANTLKTKNIFNRRHSQTIADIFTFCSADPSSLKLRRG